MTFSTFTMLWNHHLYLILKHFYHLQKNPVPISSYCLFLSSQHPLESTILLLSLWIYLFGILYINGIIQYVAYWVRLLLLSIMFLRFIHIVACIRIHCFYGYVIFHCMHIPYLMYPLIHWQTWVVSTFSLLGNVHSCDEDLCTSIWVCFQFFGEWT